MSAGSWQAELEQLLEASPAAIEPIGPRGLFVYGAGNCGRDVAKRAHEVGLEVLGFIDEQAARLGGTCEGLICLAPGSQELREAAKQGASVVIAVFNYAVDTRPIRELLRGAGFERVLSYPEFHELYFDTDNFWLTKRSYYAQHKQEILAGLEVFSDGMSRRVYYELFAYRLSFDLAGLIPLISKNQYLPGDLPPPVTPMRLIDGGAYTGDTLQSFLEQGITLEAVVAFEPDPINYLKLCATAGSLSDKLGDIILLPCGIGEETQTHGFASGAAASSAMQVNAATNVQVIALDDALPTFRPTLIKLDIEGAEPLALRGGRKMIQRFLPRLAVCVYHAPEHLWTIAKLVLEIDGRYRFFLRCHQWNGFDTVLYATEA